MKLSTCLLLIQAGGFTGCRNERVKRDTPWVHAIKLILRIQCKVNKSQICECLTLILLLSIEIKIRKVTFSQWTGTTFGHPDVISWKDLVELGESLDDTALVERQNKMAINHCATLVYTSGTTGMPKGKDNLLQVHFINTIC
jgi:acyl-coenzyme A synthetase/AMP-(fatty) acid ligase